MVEGGWRLSSSRGAGCGGGRGWHRAGPRAETQQLWCSTCGAGRVCAFPAAGIAGSGLVPAQHPACHLTPAAEGSQVGRKVPEGQSSASTSAFCARDNFSKMYCLPDVFPKLKRELRSSQVPSCVQGPLENLQCQLLSAPLSPALRPPAWCRDVQGAPFGWKRGSVLSGCVVTWAVCKGARRAKGEMETGLGTAGRGGGAALGAGQQSGSAGPGWAMLLPGWLLPGGPAQRPPRWIPARRVMREVLFGSPHDAAVRLCPRSGAPCPAPRAGSVPHGGTGSGRAPGPGWEPARRVQGRGEGFDHRDIRGSGKPPAPAACSGGSSALSPSPGSELLRVLLSFIAVLEEKCLSPALL